MPRCCCCVLAPVNDEAVDVAADDARDAVVLLLLLFLVAVTTVATGAVVVLGALGLVPTHAGVVVVAAICRVNHCDGNVAVRIGDCRLMGRISSSRLDRGYRMYPPGGTKNLSGSSA